MVRSCQKTGDCPSEKIKKAANSMSVQDVRDFASKTEHRSFKNWLLKNKNLDESWVRNLAAGGLAALGGMISPGTEMAYADKPAATATEEVKLENHPRMPTASVANGKLTIKFKYSKFDGPGSKDVADKYLKMAKNKFGIKSATLISRDKEGAFWKYVFKTE